MSLEFKLAYTQYIEMRFPEVRENVSHCLTGMFLQDYWKVKTDLEDDDKFGLYLFLAVATGAIVIITILLLVIYIKRKSDDDTPEEEQLEELE